MIIDLARFIAAERPAWIELEQMLERLGDVEQGTLSFDEAKRFHFLYQKVAADLARVSSFASEPELRRYLESLTGRAYAEIHETRGGEGWQWLTWFTREFPCAFRRRIGAFWLAAGIMLVGSALGASALLIDPEAKEAILPQMFANHLGNPSERVREEESQTSNDTEGAHATFAGALITNNVQVSIASLALGMTFGLGTIVVLFYNGVILGLVAADYVVAGHVVFLLGWLMPHGAIELPAIVFAGQAGLLLGRALIGHGDRAPLRTRLRAITRDLMLIIGGVAVLLVWAGIVESFLSQHHQPRIPYWLKITFGSIELIALAWFLGRAGRSESPAGASGHSE